MKRTLVVGALFCATFTAVAAVGVVRWITGHDDLVSGVFAAAGMLSGALLTYVFGRGAVRVYRDPNLRVPVGSTPPGFGEKSRPIRATILIVCGIGVIVSALLMGASTTGLAVTILCTALVTGLGLLLEFRRPGH